MGIQIAMWLYYLLISPLIVIGWLPIYLCYSLSEGRWLGIKEFKDEMNEADPN